MAPSRRKSAATIAKNPTRRMMTRSIFKKQLQETNNLNSLNPSILDATKSDGIKSDGDKENKECNGVVCTTPKGKKYTIPKISTCPPAPKKNRLVLTRTPSSSSLTKATTPEFFSHPDIDVFFLVSSSRNVHA